MGTSLTATGVQFPDNSVQVAPATTGFRNKIINGDMKISQRGTSFPNASSIFTVDRFAYYKSNTSSVTITQTVDTPTNSGLSNSLRATVVTADTSIASNEYAIITQFVEGYNISDLIGVPFTLSFWVKSSKVGTHCVRLNSGGLNASYVSEYVVNVANTWEKKSIVVNTGLNINIGTWNFTNGGGLGVSWPLACGSTYHTSAPDVWNAGDLVSTANQVNCLDTVGNIFAITGVQLERGSVATEFEQRPYGLELALCQRYYQTFIVVVEANVNFSTFTYPVTMRVAPTISGGGAGFTINFGTQGAYNAYQTTRNGQTLTFTAEL